MSSQLSISYQGSYFPYAIIRRLSDWYVWNGTAFEVWADGNIGNYDVPLTSESGDLYAVDFPSTIVAGDYVAVYYEALTLNTPATADLHFPLDDYLHWDGAELTDESSVDLSAYALTTLDGVKRNMRITSSNYDTLLTELINQVSVKIESITGRRFKARDYVKWINTHGQFRLVLPDSPVQHVTRIAYGSLQAISTHYTGSGVRATVSVYVDPENATGGGVRLVSYSSVGVRTQSDLLFSDYPTLALITAAISATSGWTATVSVIGTSSDLRPCGAMNAKTISPILYVPYWDYSQYRLDGPRGIISFDTAATQNLVDWPGNREFTPAQQELLVEYRSGFETIPADVDLLARELVKEAYYAGTMNTGLKSSSLGPFSVTFNSNQEDLIRRRCAQYMDATAMVGGVA